MNAPKVLLIDIETAPIIMAAWTVWEANAVWVERDTYIMCFAAKWLEDKKLHFYSEHRHGHKETIEAARDLIDNADALITYNGRSFDLPTLNKEFIKYGITPPAPYHNIDLLAVARARFRFASNKLDHLCTELGLGNKTRHPGHELWVKCMNGDETAWKLMEKYNRQDVLLMEKLYHTMLPWIDTHPNRGLYRNALRPTCPNCGSTKVQSRGLQTTRTQKYVRYHCQGCGTWSRSRFKDGVRNENVLTQIGG